MLKRLLLLLTILATPLARAATRYDGDGVHSARLEAQRWFINRARYAPEREADRLSLTNSTPGGHPNYDACEDTDGANDFGTTTNQWAVWIASKPPLAPNARMSIAAQKHSQDMAETGQLVHSSPSSNYYPLGSSPINRHQAEHYTNSISGYYENIFHAYWKNPGSYVPYAITSPEIHDWYYKDTPIADRGHRQAILNATAREIGLGHQQTKKYEAPYYVTRDYDTQDFGRESTNHFFTDTIFYDANTNAVYDEGEGAGGIQVRLWKSNGEEAAWYDVSEACGSFAVPLNGLPGGDEIFIELRNTNATARNLSIPLGYSTHGRVYLTNNESRIYGSFIKATNAVNVGFRQSRPLYRAADISAASNGVQLSIQTLAGVVYRVESSPQLAPAPVWSPLVTVTAATSQITVTDTNAAAGRIYRILTHAP